MTLIAPTDELIIENALVFDGHSPDLVEQSLLVRNGRIESIAAKAFELPKPVGEATRVDARGRVLMPGMIDNHFHAYGISLDMLKMEASPKSYVALKARFRLERALRRGFTTVRDVAGGDIGLSMAVKEGLISSPNYYFSGPALSQTGGHGDPRAAEFDLCCEGSLGVEVVDGVENLRVAVRERLRRGAHLIKIMASGGVVSLTDPIRIPQYSNEEIQVVAEEAQRRGSYVAAHAYSPEAIRHAVVNGVRSIEHANLLNEEAAGVMAAHGAVMVPTLVTYQVMAEEGSKMGMSDVALQKNREVLDSGKTAIEIASRHEILIGFGSDLMGDLEYAQLRGLEIQHEVQGTLELMRSVTSRNAEILQSETLGQIKAGAPADLLLLDGNPFNKASVLWTSSENRLVIKSGRLCT